MFERWDHLVYRFRWATIALAVAALSLSIFGLIAAANETGVQSSGTLESDRASNLIKAELPKVAGQGSSMLLLFSDSRLSVSDPAFREALTSPVAPLHSDPTVTAVRTPYDSGGQGLISRDQHQAIVVVELKDTRAVAEKSVSRTVSRIVSEVHPGRLRLVATGDLPISAAFSSTLAADLNRAELVALPLALLLLVLIFRSAIAACIPIAIGGLTIMGGVALTLLLSRFTFVTQYAYNIVTLVGLGVSIDYSLILVSRFREELLAGASRETAVARTMATAGRAITFSGLTVAVGLSSLVLFQGGFTAVGISAAMVVAVAVLYGLTLLPATLAVLGSGVNRLRLPWQHVANGRGFWRSTATAVMRRPLVFLVPCVAVLVAAGTPFVHLRLASASADSLPPHNEARQGYDTLVRDFTGYGNSEIDVVAYFPGSTPPAVAVDALSQRLASIPGVVGVDAPITGSHVSLLVARSNQDPSGDGARDIVRTIRTQPSLPGGGQVLVTGQTASDLDLIGFLGSHAPLGLAFVLAITCVVLFLMTGSVVLPLKAVMTNLLSISASFGALVWIFEQGHLSRLLDFTPQSVDPNMPIIMFALIFGLSMDYEVLLLARIQERWKATGDSTLAVAEGLERSGRLITGAAAIMIGVFAGWGLADVVLLKALGIGIAIAIGIDATVVRALVVPAIMRLLGARNWWAPRPLARWQSHARPEPAQLPS